MSLYLEEHDTKLAGVEVAFLFKICANISEILARILARDQGIKNRAPSIFARESRLTCRLRSQSLRGTS